jgi:hypothetical protein
MLWRNNASEQRAMMAFIWRRPMILYFALGLGLDLLFGARFIGPVIDGSLLDPDSYMRLLRIRAGLSHGGFVDIVPGDASGDGALLPWSHLLDGLLLLFSAPLAPLLGWDRALRWVGLISGPVGVGALGAAIAWAVGPWADRRWLWVAPCITALAPMVASYGLLGVVHHHIPAALLVVLTLGWTARAVAGSPHAGWQAGCWAGLGIWLTPETMPFGMMGFGALALAWFREPHRLDLGRAIRHCGTAYLAVVTLAFLIDPPHTGYGAVEFDRLSLVFVSLAVAVCAIGWLFAAIGRSALSPRRCIPVAGGLALIGFGAWILAFPTLLRGTSALMTPEEAQAFFGAISEMQPIRSIGQALLYLSTGALAAGFALIQSIRRRDILWAWIALCTAGLVALGMVHLRFSTYAEIAGAAALPLWLAEWEALGVGFSELTRSLVRVGTPALFILLPNMPGYFRSVDQEAAETAAAPDCGLLDIGPWLAPHSGAIVMTGSTDAPEVLYRTEMKTVSSLFMRGIDPYMRERAAWRSRPSMAVPAEVRATRADYILACTGRKRNMLVADLPPDTLMDQLAAGHPPPWLHVDTVLPGTGLVLYRIDPQS